MSELPEPTALIVIRTAEDGIEDLYIHADASKGRTIAALLRKAADSAERRYFESQLLTSAMGLPWIDDVLPEDRAA